MGTLTAASWVVVCLASIGLVFWTEDWRYSLPTERPSNLASVAVGVAVDLPLILAVHAPHGRPALLHFYNPDCPCSRFNLEHVRKLERQFEGALSIVLVVESTDHLTESPPGCDAPIVLDVDGSLADSFGVYATPMAVVLDAQRRLAYVGNYSSGRFCVDPAREYVRLAVETLERGELVTFQLARPVFGCPLPSDRTPAEAGTR